MSMREYQVVGRRKPTEKDMRPPIYRMRIFAPNEVVAKSRFWYFLRSLKKLKKANGEILRLNEIYDRKPHQVKNYQIALRYQSRTGNHNITKEFRDMTRTGAVNQLLADMAGRHRATYRRIQIMEVKNVPAKDTIRASTKQFHDSKIKFPLPHRILRAPSRRYRTLFKTTRPSTHFY
eukprot:TRINITY_DN470_c0_g2_i14.p1 TRINITY_DN470_c0_g2~~TRINITY_DN470_c0_g2_i14.p1  ORF type:complete len:177 (-),score=2.73 TRINITY_DN470_c0_g2_i14:1-531(-)